MECFLHELHPVYGAIPGDGDFVERGDVLGLSVDAKEVVVAPFSGRVRVVATPGEPGRRVHVEIVPPTLEHEVVCAAQTAQ
jgi:hypothetical protein